MNEEQRMRLWWKRCPNEDAKATIRYVDSLERKIAAKQLVNDVASHCIKELEQQLSESKKQYSYLFKKATGLDQQKILGEMSLKSIIDGFEQRLSDANAAIRMLHDRDRKYWKGHEATIEKALKEID